MWEAFCAFHICIACFLPELLWRSVVKRAVRTFAVVILPPACQGAPYIVQRAEPVCVEALVAGKNASIFRGVDRQQAPGSLDPSRWMEFYLDTVSSIDYGISQLTVHLGYDDDESRAATGTETPWKASWRRRDFEAITSQTFREMIGQCNISLVGWRDITLK